MDTERLLAIIERQQATIELLTAALIQREGLTPKETTVIVPEPTGSGHGKLPWPVLKQRLEQRYARKVGEAVRSNADGSEQPIEGNHRESSLSDGGAGVCGEDPFGEA